MKKIILSAVILSSLLFSSILSVNAQEWFISELLELDTGIEVYNLSQIPSLEPQNFSNSSVQATYNEFLSIDRVLRNEFISQYRAGDITTYQMQDLVTSYKNFLYYTNRTFMYIAQEERWIRSKETQLAINSGYSNMRISYSRVVNIISR